MISSIAGLKETRELILSPFAVALPSLCKEKSPDESFRIIVYLLYTLFKCSANLNASKFEKVCLWPETNVLYKPSKTSVLAELQRAKRASEAPWVRKIGNPSSWENLVMTSAYDRASERANVRTDSGGGGGASRNIPHGHPYEKLFP